eukprot:TRINITY_DN9015_c0_g1_i1.p1 TRINITY_DN9015_c0_g1~~TRINITY_DN9015_c0_g1_i1.p1  ORF type:complete len:150 (+),score=33.35 TRINITY_DN9015_c0_g1_i1:109-558(+)
MSSSACPSVLPSIFSSSMRTLSFRLLPGSDLKQSLLSIAKQHQLKAACVLTCVGSLQKVHIRLAGGFDFLTLAETKQEIVSLVGTFNESGSHLHISFGDVDGNVKGGHLMEGNLIYTTAELVIGILDQVAFNRVPDSNTGCLELLPQQL